MLRLDYISCVLTVLSTFLIGRRNWHGWIVAGINSVLVCVIGYQTRQLGFIPANIFCLGMYAYNLRQWRMKDGATAANNSSSDSLAKPHRSLNRSALTHARAISSDRVFARRLRGRRRSQTSL